MAVNGWGRHFHEIIVLPDGRKITTLRQAMAWLAKEVPQAEHEMKPVQTAAHCVVAAAENESAGWMMFARMGMMQAINRHAALSEFKSKRKQRPPAKLIKLQR
ncbi:hypothetical protein HU230_0007995 [Bradyrhizobium quebecense]|uniref:Uncharacterized protein n=1 Tax=Bradyrhizobium quebecense TaxID=2748629 RepID=A0A974AHJ4_9BRAD|nr:hypothetical protein [Bradyrhizobium quebecense]UGA45968.1 hypothetical protein HU230_0007995 [Bradyrhizobium quebecense]